MTPQPDKGSCYLKLWESAAKKQKERDSQVLRLERAKIVRAREKAKREREER